MYSAQEKITKITTLDLIFMKKSVIKRLVPLFLLKALEFQYIQYKSPHEWLDFH